jgi:hypothetical protein
MKAFSLGLLIVVAIQLNFKSAWASTPPDIGIAPQKSACEQAYGPFAEPVNNGLWEAQKTSVLQLAEAGRTGKLTTCVFGVSNTTLQFVGVGATEAMAAQNALVNCTLVLNQEACAALQSQKSIQCLSWSR